MQSIAIVGSGAIGCAVGAALLEAGREVTFCARQPFRRVSLQKAGEEAKTFPARIASSERDIAPADWVLLCVKAHHVPSAAGWLRAAIGPQTKIAVLQNGVQWNVVMPNAFDIDASFQSVFKAHDCTRPGGQ